MPRHRKPRLDKTKRYYWHLSDDPRLGAKEYEFKPYVEGACRHEDEPSISRFCVATTPAGCFVAIPLGNSARPYFLYRTKRKVNAHYAYNVPDSGVTGERWRLHKSRYLMIARFNIEHVNEMSIILKNECEKRGTWDNIGSGDRDVLAAQRSARNKIESKLKTMFIH